MGTTTVVAVIDLKIAGVRGGVTMVSGRYRISTSLSSVGYDGMVRAAPNQLPEIVESYRTFEEGPLSDYFK